MKKLFLAVGTLVLTSTFMWLSSSVALAQQIKFKPYAGLDLVHLRADTQTEDLGGGTSLDYGAVLEDSVTGLNAYVGNRFHRYFGLELGYFHTMDEEKNVAAGAPLGAGLVSPTPFNSSVQLQGLTLDAIGYLPLGTSERLSLIGTAGVGWTKADIKATIPGLGSYSSDDSEFGLRLGGGAEFAVTDNVNIRALIRWQQADFDGVLDDMWTYNFGVNFAF